MSDPVDIAIGGATVGGLGAVVLGLLKWSGQRNVNAWDEGLKELRVDMKEVLSKLGEHGDKSIRLEKDLENVRAQLYALEQRLGEQSKFWRDAFESQAKQNREDFARYQATVHDWKNAVSVKLADLHSEAEEKAESRRKK